MSDIGKEQGIGSASDEAQVNNALTQAQQLRADRRGADSAKAQGAISFVDERLGFHYQLPDLDYQAGRGGQDFNAGLRDLSPAERARLEASQEAATAIRANRLNPKEAFRHIRRAVKGTYRDDEIPVTWTLDGVRSAANMECAFWEEAVHKPDDLLIVHPRRLADLGNGGGRVSLAVDEIPKLIREVEAQIRVADPSFTSFNITIGDNTPPGQVEADLGSVFGAMGIGDIKIERADGMYKITLSPDQSNTLHDGYNEIFFQPRIEIPFPTETAREEGKKQVIRNAEWLRSAHRWGISSTAFWGFERSSIEAMKQGMGRYSNLGKRDLEWLLTADSLLEKGEGLGRVTERSLLYLELVGEGGVEMAVDRDSPEKKPYLKGRTVEEQPWYDYYDPNADIDHPENVKLEGWRKKIAWRLENLPSEYAGLFDIDFLRKDPIFKLLEPGEPFYPSSTVAGAFPLTQEQDNTLKFVQFCTKLILNTPPSKDADVASFRKWINEMAVQNADLKKWAGNDPDKLKEVEEIEKANRADAEFGLYQARQIYALTGQGAWNDYSPSGGTIGAAVPDSGKWGDWMHRVSTFWRDFITGRWGSSPLAREQMVEYQVGDQVINVPFEHMFAPFLRTVGLSVYYDVSTPNGKWNKHVAEEFITVDEGTPDERKYARVTRSLEEMWKERKSGEGALFYNPKNGEPEGFPKDFNPRRLSHLLKLCHQGQIWTDLIEVFTKLHKEEGIGHLMDQPLATSNLTEHGIRETRDSTRKGFQDSAVMINKGRHANWAFGNAKFIEALIADYTGYKEIWDKDIVKNHEEARRLYSLGRSPADQKAQWSRRYVMEVIRMTGTVMATIPNSLLLEFRDHLARATKETDMGTENNEYDEAWKTLSNLAKMSGMPKDLFLNIFERTLAYLAVSQYTERLKSQKPVWPKPKVLTLEQAEIKLQQPLRINVSKAFDESYEPLPVGSKK